MDGRLLDQLFDTIMARRGASADSSWTAKLLANAPELPAQKLGEEVAETIIEAMKGDGPALTKEAADVIYHLLVLMAATGVTPQDVWAELDRRTAQSGIDEKASR
ncbi:MAG: phosphoribosyl-ATP diphosphatase [Alphaproteobacteria bacterium]|nr:phosphoribosyl-ATP diphosphatase [Alphaproteobacteria bacterium]